MLLICKCNTTDPTESYCLFCKHINPIATENNESLHSKQTLPCLVTHVCCGLKQHESHS